MRGGGGVVEREDEFLEALLAGQVLQCPFQTFLVAAEHGKAAHVGVVVLGGGFIELLEQRGDLGIDSAREDHGYGEKSEDEWELERLPEVAYLWGSR